MMMRFIFYVAGSVDKIGFKGNFSNTHSDGCTESTSIRNTQRSQHMEIAYFARSTKRFGIVYVSRYCYCFSIVSMYVNPFVLYSRKCKMLNLILCSINYTNTCTHSEHGPDAKSGEYLIISTMIVISVRKDRTKKIEENGSLKVIGIG